MVLLSIFAFLCPHTWSHDENVDYPHLYQVITGSYTLIVLVLKYFLIFGGFVRFDSDPFLAFVLWCFCPLLFFFVRPRDRITRMWIIHTCIMWSSVRVTLIVGVLKYFLIFGGFVPFDSDPFLDFVLFCFCPFLLFSVRPRDRMTRMLIINTCIVWSWDRAP